MESLEQRIAEFQEEILLEGWRSAGYSALAHHPSFSLPIPNFSEAYDNLNPSTEDERSMAGVILTLGENNKEAAEIIARCYQGLRKHPATLKDFLTRGKWDFSARDYSHMRSFKTTHYNEEGEQFVDPDMVESMKLELLRYGNMAEHARVGLDECWKDEEKKDALSAYLELSTLIQDNPSLLQEMIDGRAGPAEEEEVAARHMVSFLNYLGREVAPRLEGVPPQGSLLFGKLMGSLEKEHNHMRFFEDWEENLECFLVRGIFHGRQRSLTLLDILEFTIRREEYNGEWALAAL